mmetsp:Transcript_15529/g.41761  ORF Transcript_15529/g.41761 Transcript_15529/m.41761 type:complete len:92 (-) Transcript_15529:1337-1612(-)
MRGCCGGALCSRTDQTLWCVAERSGLARILDMRRSCRGAEALARDERLDDGFDLLDELAADFPDRSRRSSVPPSEAELRREVVVLEATLLI